jgi:hypothetical protein
MPNHTKIKLRRGTAAEWQAANELLSLGEPGFEKDTYKLKIGDGVTLWNDLPYVADGMGGSDGPLKYTYDNDFLTLGGQNTNYTSDLTSVPEWISLYTEETGFTQNGSTGNDFGFDSNGLWFRGDAQPSYESYPVRTNFDIPSDSACEIIFTINHNSSCSDQGICLFKTTDAPEWNWSPDNSRIAIQIDCPQPMIAGLNNATSGLSETLANPGYYTFKVKYTPLSSLVVVKVYSGQDTSGNLLETLILNERLEQGTDYRIGFAADSDGGEDEETVVDSYFTNLSITVLDPIEAMALAPISDGVDFSGFFEQLLTNNEICNIKISDVNDSSNFVILRAPTISSIEGLYVFYDTNELALNSLSLVDDEQYYINIDVIGADAQTIVDDAFNTNLVAGSGIALTYNSGTLTIASSGVINPGDNRVLTSDGTTTGINAESSLTFDGYRLVIDCACPSGLSGFTAIGDQRSTLNSQTVYSDATVIETEDGTITTRQTNRLIFAGARGSKDSPEPLEVDDNIFILRGDARNPHGTLNPFNGVLDNRTIRIRGTVSSSGTYYLGSTLEFETSSGGSGLYDNSMTFDHEGILKINNIPINIVVVDKGNVSGSISTDASSGQIFDMVVTGSTTLANPTNAINGTTIRWRIQQDGTGGHSVSLGDQFVIPSSASSPLPWSTTANAMDVLAATYHASREKWDIVAFVPGY